MEERSRHFGALTILAVLLVPGAVPGAISQWEFDGDLASSEGGSPLEAIAVAPAAAPSVSFSSVTIGGEPATGAVFSRGTCFRLLHGLGPNGGGSLLNRYTVIIDCLFPDRSPSGGWAALLQTDAANGNDGDWFVNPSGGIGISGQYGGTVAPGTWNRLGLSVDLAAGTFTAYVNGAQAMRLLGLPRDGRFALPAEVLLFGDDDGENAEGVIASLQVRDEPLDDAAMAALGGATAGGISRETAPVIAPVGLWTFDDPADPEKAAIGRDLTLSGTRETIPGTSDADGAVRIGVGSFYRSTHGIPPSGGSYVNAFTFAFDFRIPSIGRWYCFYQTNPANSNDGECFVRSSDGALGVGATGYSARTVDPGTWYRLVVAVDNAGGRYDMYLDGDLVLDGTPQPVDSRFSLDPEVLFFADENGEDGPIDIASLAVYDRALDAVEIERLGGPGPVDPDNRAPAVVAAPAGPGTLDASIPGSFQFRAADEDGDRARIRVDWGDGTVGDWSDLAPAGEPITLDHTFRRTGILQIRAQARDEHGLRSDWTAIQSIEVTGDVPAAVIVAPYLQDVRPDGISILWELDAPAACRLEYGPDASYGLSVDAEAQETGNLSTVFRARLRGLPPATTHHYRVVVGSRPLEDGTFRTAPAESGSFSFSVWSDSQGTNGGTYPADPLEPAKSMFDDMVAQGVDFGVASGDMAESGADFAGVHRFFLDRVAGRLGRSVPFFIAWGNHDQGRSAVIRKYVDSPSRDRPGFDPGWGSFSFDYSGCHFVCIDYDTMHSDISGWLEDDLAAAVAGGARFTFLFIHVPPFCEVWIDGDSWLRSVLVPLMVRYGVDACFSGHTHEYERGILDGTAYVVTGGGSWLDFPEPLTVNWPHITVGGYQSLWEGIDKGLVNEYVRVRVEGDAATIEMHAFRPDGTPIGILDSFTIDRCGNGNGLADDGDGDGIPDGCEDGRVLPDNSNGDGFLDVSDSLRLLLHLFGSSPAPLPCGDGTRGDPANIALLSSNGDETLDITDAVHGLQYLFAGGPPPALGIACRPIAGCPARCGR